MNQLYLNFSLWIVQGEYYFSVENEKFCSGILQLRRDISFFFKEGGAEGEGREIFIFKQLMNRTYVKLYEDNFMLFKGNASSGYVRRLHLDELKIVYN